MSGNGGVGGFVNELRIEIPEGKFQGSNSRGAISVAARLLVAYRRAVDSFAVKTCPIQQASRIGAEYAGQ